MAYFLPCSGDVENGLVYFLLDCNQRFRYLNFDAFLEGVGV